MSNETVSNGRGHTSGGPHPCHAASTFTEIGGQAAKETHHHVASDLHPIIGRIREQYRQRVDLHRAEKSLTLQIKAKCRRLCEGDKTEGGKLYKSMQNGKAMENAEIAFITSQPFLEARALIENNRKAIEKMLEKMARELPVWEHFCKDVLGFGALSLAAVIGEAGDLNNYSTVSKLWKRMGLAVINGGRQRCVTGTAALDHGYSPQRRSMVWNIGECLIKQQGHYRQVYLDRIATEVEKARAEGLVPATTVAATIASWEKRGLPALEKVSKIIEGQHRGAGHMHNRAKRYAEKRLLRDLWAAWRAAA